MRGGGEGVLGGKGKTRLRYLWCPDWLQIDDGWRFNIGGWRVTDGGWRLTGGGWCLSDGGWCIKRQRLATDSGAAERRRLAANRQRVGRNKGEGVLLKKTTPS